MLRKIVSAFARNRPDAGWLTVELGASTARFAHVRPDGARPVVEFAEEREWDPQEPKSLQRVAREFQAQRFRCTTLLKPDEYQILLVEAPPVKREELKPALRWRIKDLLDYHVDDATIDVLDLPLPSGAAPRPAQLYAVAARNDAIRATIARLEAAGIALAVIDIPDTAQRNLAAHYESAERGVMALSFDGHGGLITVNFSGELYLSRRLDIPQAQLATADAEQRAHLLERVLVEMQRSLDHCERTYSFFALGRVVIAPLPGASLLREHLAANLYLPVEVLELAEVLRLPPEADDWTGDEQARWLKLLGAGLRVEKKAL